MASTQLILGVKTTSEQGKSNLQVIIKHDVLYTRAWERENKKTIFDDDQEEPGLPNSAKNAVQSDFANDERSTNQGTVAHKEISPSWRDTWLNGYRSRYYLQGMRIQSGITLLQPNPKAQNTIRVITLSWTAMLVRESDIFESQVNFPRKT